MDLEADEDYQSPYVWEMIYIYIIVVLCIYVYISSCVKKVEKKDGKGRMIYEEFLLKIPRDL